MAGDVMEVEVAGVKFVLRKDLRYTESDEWARLEDGIATVGITDFAQKELKDVVGVELPEKGRKVRKGEAVATVESIKATADIYAPLSGEIVDVNEKLLDQPELIKRRPVRRGLDIQDKSGGSPRVRDSPHSRAVCGKCEEEEGRVGGRTPPGCCVGKNKAVSNLKIYVLGPGVVSCLNPR